MTPDVIRCEKGPPCAQLGVGLAAGDGEAGEVGEATALGEATELGDGLEPVPGLAPGDVVGVDVTPEGGEGIEGSRGRTC